MISYPFHFTHVALQHRGPQTPHHWLDVIVDNPKEGVMLRKVYRAFRECYDVPHARLFTYDFAMDTMDDTRCGEHDVWKDRFLWAHEDNSEDQLQGATS